MNFLKKFFSKPVPEFEKVYKKRAPRIRLQDGKVTFTPDSSAKKQGLEIANLSASGLAAVDKESHMVWPKIGGVISGKLTLAGKSFPVACKVVHFTGNLVGCQFQDFYHELTYLINDYYRVELEALNLVHIKPDILKSRADGVPHYFQGGDNCEVYYVINDGEILQFNISFFMHYLEGGKNKLLRFGKINKSEQSNDVHGYKRNDIIEWQEEIPLKFREDCVRFLSNIEHLKPNHIEALKSLILSNPYGST